MIKNINYLDEDVLHEELEKIFHESWFFVGLTDKLNRKNDYITYRCGFVSIFVQNNGKELKCFSNICLHRFNTIFQGAEGNGPIMCSYHNWVYDENGFPLVKSEYNEVLSSSCKPKLEQHSVDKCGKFVFVKVNKENTLSLRDHLGSFYEKLIEISSSFEKIFNDETIEIDHKANWKLLVENVLECYHCISVHKETLVPIGLGVKKPENHFYENGHDRIDFPLRISATQSERNRHLTFLTKTLYSHNSLQHWYVYPNLFITSTAGSFFYIGKLMPKKPNFTQLHAQFVMPAYKNLTKREEILLNAYMKISVDASKRVIDEDKEILEVIQLNLQNLKYDNQIFGEEEFRIDYFHQNICKIIKFK